MSEKGMRLFRVRVSTVVLHPGVRSEERELRIVTTDPDEACRMAMSRYCWMAWMAGGIVPKNSLPMRVLGIA